MVMSPPLTFFEIENLSLLVPSSELVVNGGASLGMFKLGLEEMTYRLRETLIAGKNFILGPIC